MIPCTINTEQQISPKKSDVKTNDTIEESKVYLKAHFIYINVIIIGTPKSKKIEYIKPEPAEINVKTINIELNIPASVNFFVSNFIPPINLLSILYPILLILLTICNVFI